MQSGKDTVTKIIQWLLLNQDKGTEIPFDRFDLYKEAATWKNVKFADKLKDMVCLLLGCTREQLEDPKFKEKELGEEWWYWKLKVPNHNLDRNEKTTLKIMFNTEAEAWEYNDKVLFYNREVCETVLIKLTPRLLLQLLGTECGRNIIHPNIWVNATFADFADKEEWFRKETGLTRTEYLTKNGHSDEYKDLNEQFFKSLPNWIISDVRFPNEAKAIKDRGGINIRVERFTSIKTDLVYFKNNAGDSPINGIYRVLEVKEDNCTLIDDKTGYSFGAWFEEISKIKEHESETALDNYNDWDYVIDNNGTIEDLIEKVKQILIKEKIWKAY